ncbi:MAG TPA: DinB family protein [Pyrinomonadaceae bacterium]|nr:DinB family protein [Pyrinomonadaceae bacterium]
MKRSDIDPMPEYWERYIKLVPDVELPQAFDDSIQQLEELDRTALARIADKTYSPGKWTIKDIVQHLTDVERIMCYRALMFARRDGQTPLGFEQDFFAANSGANRRTIDELLDELVSVRRATKALYDSFDDDMLKARGVNWEVEVSVTELGFTILGHQIHHLNVMAERYSAL